MELYVGYNSGSLNVPVMVGLNIVLHWTVSRHSTKVEHTIPENVPGMAVLIKEG